MKKIDIILICLVLALVLGCKKKPAEPQPVSLPPASAAKEVEPIVKTDTIPAPVTEPAIPAKESAVRKSESVIADRLVWMTDFEAAQKQAAAEGKDLFINFTGSDWCGWCMRLDKEVFSQKLFIYEAQKRFVFVYLDFPRTKKQSDALKAQNEKLAQRYEVGGFPTIILATADGRPYGKTGYEQGGPVAYLQELARLQSQKPAK